MDEHAVSLFGFSRQSAGAYQVKVVRSPPGTELSGLPVDTLRSGESPSAVASRIAAGALNIKFASSSAAFEGVWLDLGRECLVERVNLQVSCTHKGGYSCKEIHGANHPPTH